jgi:hypothetical protein
VLVCRKCGSPNPDQARFCHYDGENLTGLPAVQPAPTPPKPAAAAVPAGVPSWAKWLGVAGLAIVVVMTAGYVSGWLAVLIALASLAFAGWRIHEGQVWRRPDWWRIEQHEHPGPVCWSIGATVGMALSLGIFGLSRSPPPVENGSVAAANDPAVAMGAAPNDPAIVPVEVFNPSPPEDTPVRFSVIASPLTVSTNARSNAGYAVDGNIETVWSADAGSWWEVTFDGAYEVDGVVVFSGEGGLRRAQLEFSDGSKQIIEVEDGRGWRLVPLTRKPTTKVRITPLNPQGRPAGAAVPEFWCCHRGLLSPSGADWSGVWQSDSLGTVEIRQEGDWIRGVYQVGPGRLVGRSTGLTLQGNWSNPGSGGEVALELSRDRRSFSGKWNDGAGLSWYEDDFFSGRRP